jgi:N-acetyl-alpha-D-muramate 1-phosphate uridylyltransferase
LPLGFGTRMGALTADRPKPLIQVANKPLIDHALALADAAGIAERSSICTTAPRRWPIIWPGAGTCVLSREVPQILDTGGGLRQALPLLGPGPVFTLELRRGLDRAEPADHSC